MLIICDIFSKNIYTVNTKKDFLSLNPISLTTPIAAFHIPHVHLNSLGISKNLFLEQMTSSWTINWPISLKLLGTVLQINKENVLSFALKSL